MHPEQPSSPQPLIDLIRERAARVGVVGLGYVGLPLAIAFAEAGFRVVGQDVSKERIAQIRSGSSPVEDVDDGALQRVLGDGRFAPTADPADLSICDCVVIAVPTPLDEHQVPDLTSVRAASMSVASVIRRGCLVVLESTTYPGTTEEIVAPALEKQGLSVGREVFLGYSPERIDPGNETWNITNTPKIVAGIDDNSLRAVDTLYSAIVERTVHVSSLRTAETAKLFENIFRIVNIALVNEFQMICDSMGIDVWEVLDACSTKPYGFMRFVPGPGLGGHCVPVDPFYLSWKAREYRIPTEFIELAGRINAEMPKYVVEKVVKALSESGKPLKGSSVALVGVAYKKNTADLRESPAIRLAELLLAGSARVTYHDPLVEKFAVGGRIMRSSPLTEGYLREQDCVVIVTDHDDVDWQLIARVGTPVLDTRNRLARPEVAVGLPVR